MMIVTEIYPAFKNVIARDEYSKRYLINENTKGIPDISTFFVGQEIKDCVITNRGFVESCCEVW